MGATHNIHRKEQQFQQNNVITEVQKNIGDSHNRRTRIYENIAYSIGKKEGSSITISDNKLAVQIKFGEVQNGLLKITNNSTRSYFKWLI